MTTTTDIQTDCFTPCACAWDDNGVTSILLAVESLLLLGKQVAPLELYLEQLYEFIITDYMLLHTPLCQISRFSVQDNARSEIDSVL